MRSIQPVFFFTGGESQLKFQLLSYRFKLISIGANRNSFRGNQIASCTIRIKYKDVFISAEITSCNLVFYIQINHCLLFSNFNFGYLKRLMTLKSIIRID